MITCHVTYKIDPAKVSDFEIYAKAWIPLVKRFGGTHHGYFLPHEGPNDLAFAAFSFPSLAAYETYRTDSAADPDCKAAYDFAVRTKCILRYDRHFLRPVLDGDISGVLEPQA
ncbi:NIPSNAP protein [Roseovarius tolerans]|uniref:NIPSNAP protein n=1 Tax=Roseovarius tolerans TaxID=74031 RepID=A0A1H8D865_9RHOB|nr:NIPSNAP family protein [Roseovarius tolerans]SEN03412.1 NIPSNAP protein [Roseovarius tolerans]